jgi:3-oxoacyl-[acyl-carrier protein] reductase
VKRLYSEVKSAMGPPLILFNNAGLTLKSGVQSIADVSMEDFEHTWRANCGSAFLLTQLAMPAMEESGWGRIIFCSSVAGFIGGVVGPHYAYVTRYFCLARSYFIQPACVKADLKISQVF